MPQILYIRHLYNSLFWIMRVLFTCDENWPMPTAVWRYNQRSKGPMCISLWSVCYPPHTELNLKFNFKSSFKIVWQGTMVYVLNPEDSTGVFPLKCIDYKNIYPSGATILSQSNYLSYSARLDKYHPIPRVLPRVAGTWKLMRTSKNVKIQEVLLQTQEPGHAITSFVEVK